MADPEPIDLEPVRGSDIPSLLQQGRLLDQNHAKVNIFNALDDDPEQAARAVDLSRDTGVPAPIIHGNQDNFERQYKAALASGLIEANPHLADYVNSHPLGAAISHDDLGQLDVVSQVLKKYGAHSVLDAVGKGFKENFDAEGINAEHQKLVDLLKQNPWTQPVAEWLGAEAKDFVGLMHFFGGVIGGAAAGVGELQRQLPDALQRRLPYEMRPEALVRDLIVGAQTTMGVPMSVPGMMLHPAVRAEFDRIGSYVRAGEPIPPGVSPLTDEAIKLQAKDDAKNFAELEKAVAKTATLERSPEMIKEFLRLRSEQKIGIPFEAVQKLYGEKQPVPGDGLLGDVAGFDQQYAAAGSHGGDLQVPLEDWLVAQAQNPELRTALKDDIRFRPNGMTLNETKEAPKPMVEAFHGTRKEFEAFDTGMIGTGQGAQSYGYGHYVAEHRGVAETYRQAGQLGEADRWSINGKEVSLDGLKTLDNAGTPEAYAAVLLERFSGDIDSAIIEAKKQKGDLHYPAGIEALEQAKQNNSFQRLGGNLMRVRIHREPEEFLDWDKKLSEQSPHVQAVLKKLGIEGDLIDMGEFAGRKITAAPRTGSEIYSALSGDKMAGGNVKASKALSEAGIAGIRYLDQESREILKKPFAVESGSRDTSERSIFRTIEEARRHLEGFERAYPDRAGEFSIERRKGTYNYVVFSDKDLEVTHINDAPLNAVMARSSLYPKIEPAIAEEPIAPGGEVMDFGYGYKALLRPRKEYTEIQQGLVSSVEDEMRRMGIHGVDVIDVDKISAPGATGSIAGSYIQYADRLPVILWSLTSKDPIGTAWHETIHHLRSYGFFSPDEWKTLESAAEKNDWIGKHNIEKHYGHLDGEIKLEEAIAEEFRYWMHSRQEIPTSPWGRVMEKLLHMVDFVGEQVKKLIGEPATFDEIFQKVEAGEVGAREAKPITEGVFKPKAAIEDEGPGPADVFARGAAFGRSQMIYKRYKAAIDKWIEGNQERQRERAMKDEKRRQTAEWKENESRISDEVRTDIQMRPDVLAQDYLSRGRLFGQASGKIPRLDSELVDPSQRAPFLPEKYFKEGSGVGPDDLAGLFGYTSGKVMLDEVAKLEAVRGTDQPKVFLEKAVKAETERRMQKEYGDLQENIISEAEDHVLSPGQMEFLHEQTMLIGSEAGLEMPYTKEDMQASVKGHFDTTPIELITSKQFLNDAGRAGRKIEENLLKGDVAEAFKEAQRQEWSTQWAKLAKDLEKRRAQFDKIMKKFKRGEVPGVDPAYTNFIHMSMVKIGQPIGRTLADLQKEISKGAQTNFVDFINDRTNKVGRDLHVPDFMLDPNFNTPLEKLTAEEFGQVHAAIKSLEFNGRDELKVYKAGESADLEETLGAMIEKVKSLGDPIPLQIDRKPSKVVDTTKAYWWSGITIESMLNRIDRNDPRGLMYQYIMRGIRSASNSKDAMLKEYRGKLQEIADIPDMDKKIDNQLFLDRETGEPILMRKRNVLGILQNWGNESNRRKLSEGYGLEQDQVLDFLLKNTTKDDWDRAQKIGNLFAELFDKADNMSRQISGTGIEGLELKSFEVPGIGTYEGWYNPVKYDRMQPGSSKTLLGPTAENEGYFRATTPQGYTKGRTEYIAPVELNLDIVPIRMKQMIHDINIRPTVIQLSKFFYNDKFKNAMLRYYGKHQAEEFIPFLRDFAGSSNYMSMSQHMGEQALEFFRQNTIASLIGFNPSTVMKHGPTAAMNSLTEVGPINFAREFFGTIAKDDETGKTNWQMAMGKSEELQRRMRTNFSELIRGHEQELTLAKTSWRDFMISAGATPVSLSDLASAVPTWLAKYKEEIAKGTSEGLSISLADRAVVRAHGSSALYTKPSIMRTNALGAWFSSLYGFFSHMQQRQYEMAWKAKDLLKDTLGKGSGDEEMATRHAPDLLKGFISYIIFPALVEELVTPYTSHDKESWGWKAAKTLAFGLSSSFVGVRDFVRGLINLRDPAAGLIGTSLKAATDLGRDIGKGSLVLRKDHAGNLIKHTFALGGVLTGLTNAQEGKALEFLYRYNQGLEKPKGPWGALVGTRYGTLKGHSQTFDEYMKGLNK